MSFTLRQYYAPDFTGERFRSAPEAALAEAPLDGVAPEGYHAMSIFPEYFKLGGRWLLAEESRIITVFSPVSRVLKTTFSIALGQYLSDKGKTIYINMEGYSG